MNPAPGNKPPTTAPGNTPPAPGTEVRRRKTEEMLRATVAANNPELGAEIETLRAAVVSDPKLAKDIMLAWRRARRGRSSRFAADVELNAFLSSRR